MEWLKVKNGAYLTTDKRYLALLIKDAIQLKNSFPPGFVKSVSTETANMVCLPYDSDALRILRNVGIDTKGIEVLRHAFPHPLIEGEFPLQPHQVTTAAFFSENERAYCTSTPRTGKTASAIVAARFLQRTGKATGCLVIATKTNMYGVWQKEIEGMYPEAIVVVLHSASSQKRRELLKQDAHFYIINYDGLKIVKDELIARVEEGSINTVIVDELTHYANSRSQLWDAANQVLNGERWNISPGKEIQKPDGTFIKFKGGRRRLPPGIPVKYVWGLTGTPGNPEMVYGEIKLITPRNMAMAFTTWRDLTMYRINFKYFPREGHKDNIYQRMSPCIRYDKNDIMNLPPVTFRGADADLTPVQQKLYKEVKKAMLAVTESGDKIKAPTKSALVQKLLQIAQGVVKVEGDTIYNITASSRIDALEELINSASQKVVIFCAFTAVIDYVREELKKRGYSVDFVDGRVTTQRAEVFRKFQYESDPQIIICHPRTTAFGVELAAADTIIFYGPPLSGDFVYQQAIERLSSLKQKAASIQIIQQSACSEERRLFRSIRDGVSINEAINKMFTVHD